MRAHTHTVHRWLFRPFSVCSFPDSSLPISSPHYLECTVFIGLLSTDGKSAAYLWEDKALSKANRDSAMCQVQEMPSQQQHFPLLAPYLEEVQPLAQRRAHKLADTIMAHNLGDVIQKEKGMCSGVPIALGTWAGCSKPQVDLTFAFSPPPPIEARATSHLR